MPPTRRLVRSAGRFFVEGETEAWGMEREVGLYTRNDGVMRCEVGFAGFASKDFVRVEVDIVGEAHRCGDSDFAVLLGRSRCLGGGRDEGNKQRKI